MPLPATVRVKLSSEEAGAISITPVVVRELRMRELLGFVLVSSGKRRERIREILLGGHLVSGASRLRWQGWEADPDGLDELLLTFPDPEPSRPFTESRCASAVLFGPYTRIPVTKETVSRRRLFQRHSFWDQLLELTLGDGLRYQDYSYREEADCYRIELGREQTASLRAAARLLKFPALVRQIEGAPFESVDFFVKR